jgi:hypothetical protein
MRDERNSWFSPRPLRLCVRHDSSAEPIGFWLRLCRAGMGVVTFPLANKKARGYAGLLFRF